MSRPNHNPQLTVAQLIELLRALPQDLPVATEGCDCEGGCNGASVKTEGYGKRRSYVLLERGDDGESVP